MCWSAKVSFESFGLGFIGIIIAYLTGSSPSMLLFFASIVFMQLVEGIVWAYGEDPDVNFYSSIGASALLMLQPVAAILAVSPEQYKAPLLIGYLVLGSFVELIERSADPRTLREQYKMEVDPKAASSNETPHLQWRWIDPTPWGSLFIYFTFLFVPLLLSKQYEFVIFVLLTLLVSIYSAGKGWGSMWCWIVDIMVALLCGKALIHYKI